MTTGEPPHADARPRRTRRSATTVWTTVLVLALQGLTTRPASAQQSVTDVLSFLLTNRSVQTADFEQDQQAALATRDTISRLLLVELATLPLSSSASGFSYRLNSALGTFERSSDSFGPFFCERSLTSGGGRVSLGLAYQDVTFDNIEGRNLRDGTLVAIASTLRGDAQPFDVETLALRIHTKTMTLSGNYGVSDRLDVGAALPFVAIDVSGQRVDTYRGSQFQQASASISATGPGDLLLRTKYNLIRHGASGVTLGVEGRLPTGNDQNLLGTGRAAIKPLLIGSLERDRVTFHGDVGYSVGGRSDEVDWRGAVTVVGGRRLTLIGEIDSRWIASLGRLTDVTEPRPGLVGVDTTRLSSVRDGAERIVLLAGFKWNVVSTWLLSSSVTRAATTVGLNARWTPMLTIDYAF